MSSKTLQYEFSELPLLITKEGFQCAGINGVADIEYDADANWYVTGISLDGWRQATDAEMVRGLRRKLFIERKQELGQLSPLYPLVLATLEGAWSHKVHDAVVEQIAEDRECARDNAADYRRDMRVSA